MADPDLPPEATEPGGRAEDETPATAPADPLASDEPEEDTPDPYPAI